MFQVKDNNHSSERILVLEAIEGATIKDTKGNTRNSLFQGADNVKAIRMPNSNLWEFKLNSGGLTEAMRQKFTRFADLHKFAVKYFERRGLRIKEIIEK